jgi:P4 family phage/plasmid primase-like protien
MSSNSNSRPLDDYNGWADFWHYNIGVNVIPADTQNKTTSIPWAPWQNKPIPEEVHNEWKATGAFNKGMAIIVGKVWHREDKKELYLTFIDIDKIQAINEICSRNGKDITLEQMAQKTLVEQHKDNLEKAHMYFYSPVPFPNKGPDALIGIEVKGLGKHGLAFCCPSIHQAGHPYEIIGTTEPVILNTKQAGEMIQHINRICLKVGVQYFGKDSKFNRLKPKIQRLVIDPTLRIPKGERHLTLLSTADSLLIRHSGKGKKTEEQLKDFFIQINNTLCDPEPLPENEINSIWKDALDFAKTAKQNDEAKEWEEGEEKEKEEEPYIIEEASEAIRNIYKFVTIAESKDILYYKDGVYIPGGEVLIEREAEGLFGYDLYNKDLVEIKGHIMRKTYRSRREFDTDLNVINMKNGLYDILKGEFKEHNSEYLSINQIPIVYNPTARPKLFGKFLSEVIYPAEIRTAIELMAYTFYRDDPYELYCILIGIGANGKSVFTALLTALHGQKNVSNVTLDSLINNRFAVADLENKNVNIDTELSSATIKDIAILKKLTGRQPIRIERKNQQAYDTKLYAKLFFNANKMPETSDYSDAHFRREIILSFPNQFEDKSGGEDDESKGKNKADPDLINKLTTAEELSGIFNILMVALRRILFSSNKIHLNQKTIQERREKHELIRDSIAAFIKDAIDGASTESDYVRKEDLYEAYRKFCKCHNLPIEQKETFGKILKNKHRFSDGREASGERKTTWKGVRLIKWINTDPKQETLMIEEQ